MDRGSLSFGVTAQRQFVTPLSALLSLLGFPTSCHSPTILILRDYQYNINEAVLTFLPCFHLFHFLFLHHLPPLSKLSAASSIAALQKLQGRGVHTEIDDNRKSEAGRTGGGRHEYFIKHFSSSLQPEELHLQPETLGIVSLISSIGQWLKVNLLKLCA